MSRFANMAGSTAAHSRPAPMLHVLLVLAATTGARRAQLLALGWDNIHHDTMRISFCAGWVEGPDGPVLAATKTKRRHSADLDTDTYTLLATLAPDNEHGFVFSDDHGTSAWKPNRVTKAFLRHRRKSGLRPFRLHDLRHFMATQMLQAGIPLVVVSPDSTTNAHPPHSTTTPTPSPAATPKPHAPPDHADPGPDSRTRPRRVQRGR